MSLKPSHDESRLNTVREIGVVRADHILEVWVLSHAQVVVHVLEHDLNDSIAASHFVMGDLSSINCIHEVMLRFSGVMLLTICELRTELAGDGGKDTIVYDTMSFLANSSFSWTACTLLM